MAHNFQVTFDCRDPHALADWWADALGWQVEAQDPDFIRRMVAEGQASEDETTEHNGALVWRTGAAIVHPDGAGPGSRLLFQEVPEARTVKNRVHLDLRLVDTDREREVERLIAAGATRLHEGRQGPYTWVTMADPEGNEFCV